MDHVQTDPEDQQTLRAWQADEVEMPGGAGPNLLCCESRLDDCFQEGVGRRAGG